MITAHLESFVANIEELKEELVTNPHQFIWPQDDDEVTYIHVEDVTEEDDNALLV